MKQHRGSIPQRRRIFLGCEGPSEESYGALLGHMVRERKDIHVHIDVVPLNPGAGDPLALVDKALKEIIRRERGGVPYAIKAILLDQDKMGQAPDRDRLVIPRASASRLRLIWQQPNHEGLLLRHLPGREYQRPITGDRCVTQLRADWPEYAKPMTRARLSERITQTDIDRVCAVELDLAAFLRAIGWLQ